MAKRTAKGKALPPPEPSPDGSEEEEELLAAGLDSSEDEDADAELPSGSDAEGDGEEEEEAEEADRCGCCHGMGARMAQAAAMHGVLTHLVLAPLLHHHTFACSRIVQRARGGAAWVPHAHLFKHEQRHETMFGMLSCSAVMTKTSGGPCRTTWPLLRMSSGRQS